MRTRTGSLLLALSLTACGDDAGSMTTATSVDPMTSSGTQTSDPGTTTDAPSSTGDGSTGPGPTSTDGPGDSDVDSSADGASESSTGEPLPRGQWAITEITYASGATQQVLAVDDCVFCDATLNDVTLLVRFQQAEGWTVWTIDIPVGSGVGAQPITDDYSGAYVAINETGPELPPELTGFYDPTSGSGTLTLTEADLSPGGVVAGTISAQLSQGSATADLQAEFYAEIP